MSKDGYYYLVVVNTMGGAKLFDTLDYNVTYTNKSLEYKAKKHAENHL